VCIHDAVPVRPRTITNEKKATQQLVSPPATKRQSRSPRPCWATQYARNSNAHGWYDEDSFSSLVSVDSKRGVGIGDAHVGRLLQHHLRYSFSCAMMVVFFNLVSFLKTSWALLKAYMQITFLLCRKPYRHGPLPPTQFAKEHTPLLWPENKTAPMPELVAVASILVSKQSLDT
jgi:hypothetical protein